MAQQFLRHTEKWQNEVWDYYNNLGEFNFGVWWLSNMLSRVRLKAAKLQPDVDEPEIQDTGAGVDLMQTFGGGVIGQAALMKRLTVQLSVPGEGYLVGEETSPGVEQWMVRSVDEIRIQNRKYYVIDELNTNIGMEWRPLAENAIVTRIWRPDDRFYHLADSPARSAREVMRELELVNRKIQAEYLSRLASAGVLGIPDDITFPVREEFEDAPNPLVAEFIEIAAQSIKEPGTASSVIPIPIVGPAESIAQLRHIDFTVQMDEKIIEKRDSAIRRLAMKLDMPSEILLGMGKSNHWSAWQIEEGALKTHIAPIAELICDSLTRGYLQPRLKASGEDPADWVVWYDMSELALRPDHSDNATLAYDRMEISGEAYRRELGFGEDDAPTPDDLRDMGLKILLKTVPGAGPSALDKLVGEKVLDPAETSPVAEKQSEVVPAPTGSPAASGTNGGPPKGPPQSGPGAPSTPKSGTPPAKAAAERAARFARQAQAQHMITFTTAGRTWSLLHPELCHEHEYTCPYTHAVTRAPSAWRPGLSGTYLCHLDPFGQLKIDGRDPYADTRSMIRTELKPKAVNGHG
jgi:hypothetical protein